MSDMLENIKGDINGMFDGRREKYLADAVMHRWGWKVDGKNQAIFIGLEPDPVFFGHFQNQPLF